MPGIKFTKENLLEKNKLPPGWYKLITKQVEEKISKGGDSTNFWVYVVVSEGPGAGTPIRICFNEQVMGPAVEYCFAHGATDKDLENAEVISILQKTIGKTVEGYTRYVADGQFPGNQVSEWRPVRVGATS